MVRIASILILLVVQVAQCAVTWPLKASADGRYITDSADVPFFICGDNGWGTIANISKAEANNYLVDRASRGVNAILVRLVQKYFQTTAGGNLHDLTSPENFDGDAPFLTPDDWSTPNSNYFLHAKWVMSCAKSNGIAVIVCPQYLGINSEQGFYDEVVDDGTNHANIYGQFIGGMFDDLDNTIYCMNGDRLPGLASDAINHCVAGIQAFDTDSLFTAHVTTYSSYYMDRSWLTLNSMYTSVKWQSRTFGAWNDTPARPVLALDFYYENEQVTGDGVRPLYWRLLSCGAISGFSIGNNPIWFTGTKTPEGAWSNWWDSTARLQATNVNVLMTNRDWWLLVPDIDHAIVTNGYGTSDATSYVGSCFSSSSNWGYAYFPAGGTIGVKMDYFAAGGTNIVTSWINPATGAEQGRETNPPSGGKNFTAPSSSDWILLFDPEGETEEPPAGGGTTNYYRAYMQGKIEMSGKAVLE